MSIRSQYYSSNTLHFFSDASTAAYVSFSSQMIVQHGAGSSETYAAGYYASYTSGTQAFASGYQAVFSTEAQLCAPVVTAATSGTNPAFAHLTITGSSSSALDYKIEAPRSPYGQRLSIKCLKTSTSSYQSVYASTDGSITWDGTNQVIRFTSSSAEGHSAIHAVAISSQRWHLLSYSTTNAILSTSST